MGCESHSYFQISSRVAFDGQKPAGVDVGVGVGASEGETRKSKSKPL